MIFNTKEENQDTKESTSSPEKDQISNSSKDGEIKQNPFEDVDKDIIKVIIDVPVKKPAKDNTNERSSLVSAINAAINRDESRKHQGTWIYTN